MVLGIGLGILGVLVALGVASRKEQGELVQRMSLYLYKLCCIYRLPFVEGKQVSMDLERQNPGANSRELLTEYYVEKMRLVIFVLFVGSLLTTFMAWKVQSERKLGTEAVLERRQVGEGEWEAQLSASIDGTKEEVIVNVLERQLREEEVQEMFQECADRLEQEILGENSSLTEVKEDLVLPDALEGYPFEIVWKSSEPMIIGTDGSLRAEKAVDRESICLTATLYYGERSYHREWLIQIAQTEYELTTQRRLLEAVGELDRESCYEEVLPLPKQLDGALIKWERKVEDKSLLFLGLTFGATVGVFILKDKDLHEQSLQRKRGMKIAYPIILNKFVLYMGAGMTVRGSFLKVANGCGPDMEKKPEAVAYEEMQYSCHELAAGVSEGLVYERFGKRSGLQEYTRFAAMLGQNLKKGNATLLSRLREESDKAMLEDLQYRKKLGEEAQTKLLVPMIMMLGIVMLLVMLPAFTSF